MQPTNQQKQKVAKTLKNMKKDLDASEEKFKTNLKKIKKTAIKGMEKQVKADESKKIADLEKELE